MIINLTGYNVIIDDEDVGLFNSKKWRIQHNSNPCVVTKGTHTHYLHRIIINAKQHQYVDHINGNALDNRKCNLRICTNQQNSCNTRPHKNSTSKYKGVSYNKTEKKWIAQICKDYKQKRIGRYDTEEEAALAYNTEAKILHGKFAYINQIN